MMYPQYSNSDVCGGQYSLHGNMCQWEVTHEVGRVVARLYGDSRYEGKAYAFPTRRDALIALEGMIYKEVA